VHFSVKNYTLTEALAVLIFDPQAAEGTLPLLYAVGLRQKVIACLRASVQNWKTIAYLSFSAVQSVTSLWIKPVTNDLPLLVNKYA